MNQDCEFRRIYKVRKGFYPTLQSVVMRELLANGSATTEKGTYSLMANPPYIAFKYAPKPIPNYEALAALIKDYNLKTIDNVSNHGGLWIAGSRYDDLLRDFVKEAREIGCEFGFYPDSRALFHKSGWCHRVEPKYLKAYGEAFGQRIAQPETSSLSNFDDKQKQVLELIQKSGFEYVDKRSNGGCLWIIAGQAEGKALTDQCKKLGVSFAFTAKGGRASQKRPAWYSKS